MSLYLKELACTYTNFVSADNLQKLELSPRKSGRKKDHPALSFRKPSTDYQWNHRLYGSGPYECIELYIQIFQSSCIQKYLDSVKHRKYVAITTKLENQHRRLKVIQFNTAKISIKYLL